MTERGFSRETGALQRDLAALPLRTRWRYTLRPAWLRHAINRVWAGRWSELEVTQIKARAHEDWLLLQELVDDGSDAETALPGGGRSSLESPASWPGSARCACTPPRPDGDGSR